MTTIKTHILPYENFGNLSIKKYTKLFPCAGSFFVRFGKNSISSKVKKLDFYQKLDSKSQKTRFWVIKLLPKVFKFYNFQVKVALKSKTRRILLKNSMKTQNNIKNYLKFEPKAQKLDLKVQKLDLKAKKLDLKAKKLDFSAF